MNDEFNKSWLWILAVVVVLSGYMNSTEPEVKAAREARQVVNR